MHIDVAKPKPSDEMVDQLADAKLAQKLVDQATETERTQLRVAQDFQESVVAPLNQRGVQGSDALGGTCIARLDADLFLRIQQKHGAEIKADPKKFWLVTAPKLYPEFGMKPKYHARTRVFVPGKLKAS